VSNKVLFIIDQKIILVLGRHWYMIPF